MLCEDRTRREKQERAWGEEEKRETTEKSEKGGVNGKGRGEGGVRFSGEGP